jgi:hypothetical protein
LTSKKKIGSRALASVSRQTAAHILFYSLLQSETRNEVELGLQITNERKTINALRGKDIRNIAFLVFPFILFSDLK